jgi:hypothetical protein
VGTSAVGASPPDGTWRRLSARLVAPLGAQSLQLQVGAESEGSAQSTSRIDLVQVPEPVGAARGLVALLALAGLTKLLRRGRRR